MLIPGQTLANKVCNNWYLSRAQLLSWSQFSGVDWFPYDGLMGVGTKLALYHTSDLAVVTFRSPLPIGPNSWQYYWLRDIYTRQWHQTHEWIFEEICAKIPLNSLYGDAPCWVNDGGLLGVSSIYPYLAGLRKDCQPGQARLAGEVATLFIKQRRDRDRRNTMYVACTVVPVIQPLVVFWSAVLVWPVYHFISLCLFCSAFLCCVVSNTCLGF